VKIQKKFTPKRERDIQGCAQLIYTWIQQLPSPADGAAAIAMVQCALIMGQNPPDEKTVRERMAATTEGVVDMWKQQVSQQSETRQ
jgi:hypothetical protein